MKNVFRTIFVASVIVLLSVPAIAAKALDQVSYATINPSAVQPPVSRDKDLASKYSDFEEFAKSKVKQLNRNHRFCRSRMKITKQADGTYRARYYQIDDSTLSIKVRRSKSSSIPYVGVLSYREQVFESSATTPELFDQSSFAVVEVIPNRHIFSYRKGTWN